MSSSLRKFWKYVRRNETARGLFLVGIVILGALAIWGGIRLALSTEYPILVVSSGSMCPPTNCVLPVGSLIVIRGEDPRYIVPGPPDLGTIIVFRPYVTNPDYLVVHRVIHVYGSYSQGTLVFATRGDANFADDSWDPSQGGPGISPSQVVGIYQGTVPIPLVGSAILGIRNFMYDDSTGQPRPEGILVIVVLIIALFAFEVVEPSKKPKKESAKKEESPVPAAAPSSPSVPSSSDPPDKGV